MCKEPVKIGEVLKDLLKKNRYLSYRVNVDKAIELWNKQEDKTVKGKTKAVGFKNGTLIVHVNSPVLANELSLKERFFIRKINRELGLEIVKKIHFKSGFIKNDRRIEENYEVDLKPSIRVIKKAEEIVNRIKDEELKESLKNLILSSYVYNEKMKKKRD